MADQPPRSPSLAQVLDQAIDGRLGDAHFALPAVVKSYDAGKQLVDVQPLVDQLVLTEEGALEARPFPIIKGVPVVFPGANGYRLTFPIADGDTVLVICADLSIDKWKNNGGQVNPADTRRFNVNDAMAIPGLHPKTQVWTGAATNAATLGKDGGPQVVFRSDKIELGADAANPPTDNVSLASLVKAEIQKVIDKFNSLVNTYNSHTHVVTGIATAGTAAAQTQTVPVPTQTPSSQGSAAGNAGDVKSTVLLAK